MLSLVAYLVGDVFEGPVFVSLLSVFFTLAPRFGSSLTHTVPKSGPSEVSAVVLLSLRGEFAGVWGPDPNMSTSARLFSVDSSLHLLLQRRGCIPSFLPTFKILLHSGLLDSTIDTREQVSICAGIILLLR